MRIALLANLLAIAVMGVLVLRQGRDRTVGSVPLARWLVIAGLVPLGLQVAILLLFGVGEMASGDLSGAGHLLPAAATGLLGLLAWRRPLEGGVALLVVGLLSAAGFSDPTALLILAAPQIVSGGLFLAGGVLARRATTPA
jgi:hypothetical protein